ncbi:unnamed protein product [Euphydryas editha]|uniref:Uncharacterized protein n=1 Tax=Euphydryas editha TaxID=104508 RepID=A0AAU9VAS5_EUPED|nr:unnamed protein product [Euphydryas editha]
MLFVSLWTLFLVICGVYGDNIPQAASGISAINPYYPNRNPLIPGYNPYYKADTGVVPILSYSNNQGADGSYSFSFSTGDGKQAQETGYTKDAYVDNAGEPQGTHVKEGSFSYVSPEGTPIEVTYIADENGFRPGVVQFSTDGKGALPTRFADGLKESTYNPRYNLYDPYNRNRYFGQYNNLKPYDSRYPYNTRNDPYNPYRAGVQ